MKTKRARGERRFDSRALNPVTPFPSRPSTGYTSGGTADHLPCGPTAPIPAPGGQRPRTRMSHQCIACVTKATSGDVKWWECMSRYATARTCIRPTKPGCNLGEREVAAQRVPSACDGLGGGVDLTRFHMRFGTGAHASGPAGRQSPRAECSSSAIELPLLENRFFLLSPAHRVWRRAGRPSGRSTWITRTAGRSGAKLRRPTTGGVMDGSPAWGAVTQLIKCRAAARPTSWAAVRASSH